MYRGVELSIDEGIVVADTPANKIDPDLADYQAAKAAMANMSTSLAKPSTYITRVSRKAQRKLYAIVPGLIGSEAMMAAPQEVRDPLIAQVQFPKRLGYPAEIGQLACHIVENGYFNGECVRLDGAIRMNPR